MLAAPSPESEMAATYWGRGGDSGTSIAAVIQSSDEVVPRPGVAIGASAFLPEDGVEVPLPEWRPQE